MEVGAHIQQACGVCRDIKAAFTEKRPVQLGLVNDILKTPCPGHDALLQFLLQTPSREGRTVKSPNCHLWVRGISEYVGWITLVSIDVVDVTSYHEVILVNESCTVGTPGTRRVLDTDWVDTGILREWLGECIAEHANICENPLHLSGTTSPAWLIDTVDNCLVSGSGIQDYVALSYKWGDGAYLRNTIGVLQSLKQTGGLLEPPFAGLISPTVKDTIGLTRLLGERYLWVDALCIVQDGGKETSDQLELMGVIYASAKLTIVVADGNASDGIPGLRGTSQPRKLSQPTFPLGNSDMMVIRDNPRFTSGDAAYFDRAWTFQEYHLSKRRLIVGKKQFHWVCSCATLHEDLYGAKEVDWGHRWDFKFANILLGLPDFDEFAGLAREYNGRDLTFSEDALPGASGLLAILSRSFEGGFVYGHPELFFDHALAWHTTDMEANTQKRTPSGKHHDMLRGSQLPSWSWLGWKEGSLSFGDEHSGELYDDMSENDRWMTRSITQWYSQETPTSSTRRAIQPSLWNHDSHFTDDRSELLLTQGWTKENFDSSKHLQPEKSSKQALLVHGAYVFTHASLPGRQYWRPFPIQNISGEGAEMKLPPQHAFLSCTTKRGWFGAKQATPYLKALGHARSPISILRKGRDHDEEIDGFTQEELSEIPALGFMRDGRHHCGYLQVPLEEQVSDFPPAQSDEGRIIELVALSLRRLYNTPEKGVKLVKNPQFREWYTVLWVEWIDGVAYRRGVGEVEKESWDNHDLEDVDLILG
ncbi:heterokaryon incompatibility protein-domain-containing protein [Apiospora arundinis]|uniref:Heterokaryon incompatibility protein-domain-containing protein n=1 Tax=Apiospora arundinis TaxID=335852 RepID=A0ABR2HLN2_9PEZI